MRIDRDIFYQLMTNTKRMVNAEKKLELLEKELRAITNKSTFMIDNKEIERLVKVYFDKDFLRQVEDLTKEDLVKLEEVVDVQVETSESNSD